MPYLTLAFLSALWGTSFLLIRIAASGLAPLALACGRLTVGAVALAFVALAAGWRWPRAKNPWLRLFALAAIGQAAPMLALGAAAKLTTSGDLALMMGAAPVATMLFARGMGSSEVWSLKAALGLALGLFGVALAMGAPVDPALFPNAMLGRALGLAAAMFYALGALLSRKSSRDIGSAMTATASMALSAAMLTVAWLAADGAGTMREVVSAPAAPLEALLALGTFNTALAYLVYFRLVATAGATFAALNNYIVPFVGLALGALVFAEPTPLMSWAGLAFVVAGVVVTGTATRTAQVK